jgi:hypothetical protein
MEFPTESLLAPLRLLGREWLRWFPLVALLSMIAELPEMLLKFYMPGILSMLPSMVDLGTQVMAGALLMVSVLLAMKLLIELVALMFAFAVLADLSAGRDPDFWGAMRRLASWKLQFVWIVAGLFEQTAMSMWYMGGATVLIPVGLVTPVAYEEDNGFAAFSRSYALGMTEKNGSRPGTRIAIGTTLAFFLGFLLNSAVGLLTMASTLFSAGPSLLTLLQGNLPDSGLELLHYSFFDAFLDLALSPLGMLPTVYMMTLQQMVYWEAKRGETTETP